MAQRLSAHAKQIEEEKPENEAPDCTLPPVIGFAEQCALERLSDRKQKRPCDENVMMGGDIDKISSLASAGRLTDSSGSVRHRGLGYQWCHRGFCFPKNCAAFAQRFITMSRKCKSARGARQAHMRRARGPRGARSAPGAPFRMRRAHQALQAARRALRTPTRPPAARRACVRPAMGATAHRAARRARQANTRRGKLLCTSRS